ncbi:hypothetical protein VU06_03170, partial [Desulfobulbus sp. F3]|nr:hypothetical protein [Desulfobulbus sp. F3]
MQRRNEDMGKEEALRRIKRAAETGATVLDLGRQGLTELPLELFKLKNLTALLLGFNQLTSLPLELFELKNLNKLSLDINRLSSLPPEISQLTNLITLSLVGNQLTYLPPEIVQLPNLRLFLLYNNPIASPPIEIAEEGIEAIREYFAEMEGESKELAEVKIILVGEGASGKTSLVKQLHGERFD